MENIQKNVGRKNDVISRFATDEKNFITQETIQDYRTAAIQDIKLYGIMNDKTSAQITQDAHATKENTERKITLNWNINQAPSTHEPVVVHMALSYAETENMLSRPLSTYDKAVYNAIANLYYYWNIDNPDKPMYLTPQEIYKRMNGKQNQDNTAKPSDATVKKIRKSVGKMRHIDFCLDINAELEKKYVAIKDNRLTSGYIKDYLLNCTEVSFCTDKGRKVTGYRINTEPVLYTYQAAKNHLLFLPFGLLDTSAVVRDTENVTEFKLYLLQQILLIKNKARKNPKILLKTIYSATGVKTPEERVADHAGSSGPMSKTEKAKLRKAKKNDRDKIEKLLDFWCKSGWIKEYIKLDKNNNTAKGNATVYGYEIVT